MARQMTIGKKLTLGFTVVLLLTATIGAVSFIGVNKLKASRDILSERTSNAAVAIQVPFWTIKQYQNQADLIINRNVEVVKDFDASAEQMDMFRDQVKEMVDTPEERDWFAKLVEADEAFDAVFRTKIVPEVEHQIEDYIAKYDGEADECISGLEEAADKIEAIVTGELNEILAKSDDQSLKHHVEQVLAVKNMKFWILKQYQNQADLIINRNMQSVKDFDESVVQMDKYKDQITAAVESDEEKAALAVINEWDVKLDAVFYKKVVPEVERILENRIAKFDGESDQYAVVVEEMSRNIADSFGEEAQEASDQFDSVQAMVRGLVIAFSISCVVLGCIIAFALIRSLVKALSQIISSLSDGSDQVSSASAQVSSASQSLAEGATEQAAGLEETSSSLEEMSSMTRQNADNAQQANTLASEARKAADNGTESMNKMNDAIQEIQKSSDETAKIIKVIDEIAFQTNLLALNAAVEAARAGEAGKGFAVVAEEVRNLAMRSAEAAKNTSDLIEESVKNSKNGVDIAGEVSKVLEEIVGGIGKTTDLVGEIAAASQEQAQGIDQVNTAVTQMDKVTQQNAANAEESASASEELSAQAEGMNRIVGDLTALVGGNRTNTQTQTVRTVTAPSGNTSHVALPQHSIQQSDNVFHSIADSTDEKQQKVAVSSKPEDIIPLNDSDNDDFKDFNS
ncbi:MAG: methyl-accepting chemotaxis protein [Planctomycetota bacterium]|jgi:methyl-accepting chemotaxis protein